MLSMGRMIRSAKMNAPPEAHAALPRDPGEGHVADRADEAEKADNRADQRTPDLGQRGVVDEEEVPPEAVRYPRCYCACDEKAEDDVADDCRPLHDEDVRYPTSPPAWNEADPTCCLPRRSSCPWRRGLPSTRPTPCRPGPWRHRGDADEGRAGTLRPGG